MEEDANPAARSPRPFADVFGFDPFRSLFSTLSTTPSGGGIELVHTDDGFNVEIPVAGFRPEEISVTLDQDVLTVSGKSARRSFTRTLVLPDEIDPDSVRANVEHGMLTLGLGYRRTARVQRITVEHGDAPGCETPKDDGDTTWLWRAPRHGNEPPVTKKPRPAGIGAFASGHADTSERARELFDEALEERYPRVEPSS